VSRRLIARGSYFTAVFSVMLLSEFCYAEADQALQEREQIIVEVDKRLNDKTLYNRAMRAGEERTALCGTCHGPDGNAVKPETPNLAGQNPSYIVEQMAKFKDGRRKSFVMQALVKSFSLEDKINLAIYFHSQKLKPLANANPDVAAKGVEKYRTVCARCHGEDGRGEEGYARLAGQRIDYLKMTLSRFRANAKGMIDAEKRERSNANMEQVTQFLTDEEIESLAHYIAMMK